MSSAKQNQHIARLIVGAMSIDGSLSREEQKKVARSLEQLGMPELIADVGCAIEDDDGQFNLFEECKALLESLGSDADSLAPMTFRMIADVIAHDRFVSAQEATYLASVAKRFKISPELAKKIFKQVLTSHRSRLEVSGKSVDELINPTLKEFLSFDGADDLVGKLSDDSLEERLGRAKETLGTECEFSSEDVDRAMTVLGLTTGASVDEATEVWKETIETLHLPKMANLGESYVTAAISRISRINDAYRTIIRVHEHLESKKKAGNQADILTKQIERSNTPSNRNQLSGSLEDKLTGVGTGPKEEEESFGNPMLAVTHAGRSEK